MGVQLGTVWKASVLVEIIAGGVVGRGPHDPDDSKAMVPMATEGLTLLWE